MAGPFRVAIDEEGCGGCGHGRTYHVVGPDEVASSTSYELEEDAQALLNDCNLAYELGERAGIAKGAAQGVQALWTVFSADTMPPNRSSLMVWDAQFGGITPFYYVADHDTLEKLLERQFTHYVLASVFKPPLDLVATPDPLIPTLRPEPEAPPTAEPAAKQIETTPDSTWDDYMPF